MPDDPEVPGGDTSITPPAEVPDSPPADAPAPDGASSATGAFDKKAFLADLKGKLERKELEPTDVAEFANPKLQSVASTLAGKFDRLRERSERMGTVLTDKGVKLPEGKTPFDVFTDPDPSGFVQLMESLPTAAAQRAKLTNEQIQQAQQEGILEGIKRFPDLKDDVPLIAQTILADDTFNHIANTSPEYIPLLMAGIGRDIQKQRLDEALKAEQLKNTELRDALRRAGIVTATNGESSRVKASAPDKPPAAEPTDLKSIAASVMQKIKSGQIPVH